MTRPALTYEDRCLTYGDLDARSSRVARALLHDGVQPGDRVAILDKNTPEFFELQFGAAKLGAVMVAVNWRLSPRGRRWPRCSKLILAGAVLPGC